MKNSRSLRAAAAFFFCLLLIAADQAVKQLTVMNIMSYDSINIINGVFSLTYVENRGAAFSILQNGLIILIPLSIIFIIISVYVLIRLLKNNSYVFLRLICILIIAGAAGNLIDRIIRGYVVDMFYFELIDFPVFNVADCYITCAVILLIIAIFTVYKDTDFSFLLPGKKKK